MTGGACADLVARADPDRWQSAMAAPPGKRDALMALYAFNVEIARAPWAASEPLLAEIRLKWWADAIGEIYAGVAPRRYEVVEPLAVAIRAADLPKALILETIEARLFDAGPAPFEDVAALEAHIDRTAGHLMVLAARILGAREAALPVVRDYACGTGMAAFLRALPDYAARGRLPLPRGVAVSALAEAALARIRAARARRGMVGRGVLPAMLPGVLADARLRKALAASDPLAAGVMELSEFERRARLAWVALTGRW